MFSVVRNYLGLSGYKEERKENKIDKRIAGLPQSRIYQIRIRPVGQPCENRICLHLRVPLTELFFLHYRVYLCYNEPRQLEQAQSVP